MAESREANPPLIHLAADYRVNWSQLRDRLDLDPR